MPRKLTKILTFFLCFLLIFEQSGFAQVAGELDISGHFLQLRNSLLPDKFRPLHLRYLSYDRLNNNFKLLLDKGDFLKGLSPSELKGTVSKGTEEKLKEQTKTLLNYFFIGISLPNDSFWVNLRPDSPENIIDPYLAQTDVGKILLEADLQLKKDTAQFTSPETPKGKEYWEKLYKKAGELFGSENITIPTLTRPWIVPGEIIIRETPDNAYIYKATLKVMLEQDYLKDSAVYSFQDERLKALNEYSSELIRELIIPKLTKEVNNAQRYAPLRQVYYSLILAQWFKSRFYGKSGLYASLIDRKNLNGLISQTTWSKATYFKEYQRSFKEGEYNIKEPVYTPFGQSIRSYMSGGIILVPEGGMPPLAKTGEINHSAASPVTTVGGSLTKDVVRGRGTLGFTVTGGYNLDNLLEGVSLKPEVEQQLGSPQKTGSEIKPPEVEKETSSPVTEPPPPARLALNDLWNKFKGFLRRDKGLDKKTSGEPYKKKEEHGPKPAKPEWFPFAPSKENIAQARRKAFVYSDPSQGFFGVDLEYFVHAQTRLVEKLLSKDELNKVLAYLEIPKQKTEAEDRQRIIEELAKGNFNKEAFDLISGLSYKRQRLDIEVTKQSGRARTQGVYEAIANSLDALGFDIGQFGKGVKQIIDWLSHTGEDRIDVFTRTKDGMPYQLTILKDKHGQNYIQIKNISLEDFQGAAGYPIEHGTVVKVTVRERIPLKDSNQHDAQESIVEGIKKRFPYVTSVRITTQIGDNASEEVNGFRAKEVIIPSGKPAYNPQDSKGRNIHVAVSDYSIKIIDNGIGMDAEVISRMFVPKEGTKHPQPLSGLEVEREYKTRVMVVQDKTLPHRVSFSRNGRVVVAIDMPDDIPEDATAEGGLMLEFGSLLDVPESWDNIIIPTDIREGEKSNFQRAVEYAIDKIINHPILSDIEKAKYINSIIVGLDGLIKGNDNYAYTVKNIRAQAKESLAPIIANLKRQGYIILPHERQFQKIDLKGKNAIYIHENLFHWQGAQSLIGLGGEVIRGVTLGGDNHLPLVAIPFTQDALRRFRQFEREWHTWSQEYRLLIIKTDSFIAIPKQASMKFIALAQKRAKAERLNEKETKEFNHLLQLINILSAEEVATSYEITKPKENLRLAPPVEIERSAGEIDSNAVNSFLVNPPIPAAPGIISTGQVPQDAIQRYVLLENGDLIEVGSGKVVLRDITYLEPLKNGYYRIIMQPTSDKEMELITNPALDKIVDIINKSRDKVELIISPSKRYVARKSGDDYVVDLETGEGYSLSNNFSRITKMPPTTLPQGNYSDLQFSHDEKYLTYLEKEADGKASFVIVDLETKNIIKKLPLPGSDEYSLNHFANVAFLRHKGAGTMFLIDVTDGNLVAVGKSLHTDSSGAYTAIVDSNEEMSIYIHKTKKLLTANGLGGEAITSVITRWHNGQPTFITVVRYPGERVSFITFDPDSPILGVLSSLAPSQDQEFEEVFNWGGKYLFSSGQGNADEQIENIDPLQRLNQKGGYKHPHFDLFIDNSDPANPVAIDPITGQTFHYKGEIYHYYRGKFIESIYKGEFYHAFVGDRGFVKSDNAYFIDNIPAKWEISLIQGSHYNYGFFTKPNTEAQSGGGSLPGINPDKYTSVSFDGKYFLFSDPKTGDAVYFNPNAPEQQMFVSAQAPQTTVALTESKPQDAPNIFMIVPNPDRDGTYGITFKGILDGKFAYTKIERINSNTFVCYGKNILDILRYEDSGKITRLINIHNDWSIVSHNERVVVFKERIRDKYFVFDINTKETYPSISTPNSQEISLSASGRFSVHKDAEGKLVYYDHNEGDPQPKIISRADNLRNYLVPKNADVVITKDANNKYELFFLPLGKKIIFNAEHIEIDSSGNIAIFKDDKGKMNFVNLKDEKVRAFPFGGTEYVRVSRAGGYVYIIVKRIDAGSEYVYVFKEDGTLERNQYLQDFLEHGYIVPRFWEEYNLEEKTMWDRERGGLVLYRIRYAQNTFPVFERDIRLYGKTFIYWNRFADWEIINLEDPNAAGHYNYSHMDFNKHHLDSLGGGEVPYWIEEDGNIGMAASYGFTRGWINQSRSFILGMQKNNLFFLIDSAGDMIDITNLIPPGFLPTDVNGDYFVFSNPRTREIKYLDPRLVSSAKEKTTTQTQVSTEKLQKQTEAIDLWNNGVLTKRDGFIAQARAAYKPFLGLIPDQYRGEMEQKIKDYIEKIYQEQEKEALKRFQDILDGKAQELKLDDTLPFDRFQQKMSRFLEHLPAYVRVISNRISQEKHSLEKEFYFNLFTKLFALSINFDINLDTINNNHIIDGNFFEALALGWKSETQEQFNATPLIIQFIQSLKEATHNQAGMAGVRDIVTFLAHFTSQDPLKNIPILEKQLGKIFKLGQSAKEKYLLQLYDAFRSLSDIQDAIDYLNKPDGYHKLGEADSFIVFLTNVVEQVKEKERFVPQGKDIKAPADGIEISQIVKLEQQREEAANDNEVMSIDYLIEHINKLPERSEAQEAEILKNSKVQRESGAHTAEIAQNSRDATTGKQGELTVDFYRQDNEIGEKEYVEEASDNGTGALHEVALIIPHSTKADAEQIEQTGYFGTGKYTIFQGVDRVEIITKNKKRAFMFTFIVRRDSAANPTAIKLTGIREVNDERVRQGVTVRRIKKLDNTIPELDQMLTQRSWKIFAGLSQNENFRIYFINHEKKIVPLTVGKEVLSETDFKAVKPREDKEVNFGKFRIISAKDMPLQVVDKAGLRVSEIKEEYLGLIPAPLRRHIKELGIIIQIPLPLIRNRSAFEYENEYLPVIQKYVAIEFYKAIAYLTLTKTDPQFVFEGFPLDWETNDSYWSSIDLTDSIIVNVAQKINESRQQEIINNELENLLIEKGKLDREKRFVKLLLLLKVSTDKTQPELKISLLLRRLAIQRAIDKANAERQAAMLEKVGFEVGDVPSVKDVPHHQSKLSMALGIVSAHEQMRRAEDYIVPAETASERELMDLAYSVAKYLGIGQVLLVSHRAEFAGAFIYYKNENGEQVPTMLINQSRAHLIGQSQGVSQDKATETIIHELAHLLEEFMRSDTVLLSKEGYVAHMADFTHDAVGTFAEAMKYISAVTLVNRELPSLELEESSAFSPLGNTDKQSVPSAVSETQPAASSPVATGYQQAMTQLNEFIDAIKKGKYQQKAVVDLRNLPPGVEVILVGDLHARLDNLKRILNNNDNLKKIQRGEAILVILGDAVHSETNLEEMDSSVEIMQFIMKLKIENRHSVYYLLGNHDYLSSLEMKDGVQQGLLYWDKLEYLYGTGGYIDSYDNFIKASPLMAIGNGFIATHAGPIKGATYREIQDVDVANEESDIVRQAERGRYGERFGEEDIRKFLHNMGQPEEASLIVGHSPTRDGDWHWQPLPNSHFHIIFAGHDRAGYAYIQNGRLDFTEVTNVSPNLELADSAASPVRGKQLKGAESTSSPVVSAPAKFTFFKEGNSYRKAEIRRLSQLTREEIPGARKGLLKLSEVLSGHMLAISNIATELNNSEPFTSLDAFILTDTSNPDAWVIYALEEFRDYGNRRDLLLWLSSSILPDNHISIAGNQILAYAVQDALDNNMELKISHALGDRQRRAGLIKDINSRDGLSGFLRRHFYNLEGELAKNQGADGAEEFLQAIRRGGVNMTASSPSIPQQEGKGEIDVSTPLSIDAQQSDKGGIDFRGLPIVTQPIGSSPLGTAPLVGQVRPMAGTVPSLNLDKEWRQIENMAQAGLIPSNERIREYLQASCQSEDCSQRIDKVLSLFADILRLEEERVSSTEPALKDILALLESDKAAAELQVALSKIEVLAQEPQLIEQ